MTMRVRVTGHRAGRVLKVLVRWLLAALFFAAPAAAMAGMYHGTVRPGTEIRNVAAVNFHIDGRQSQRQATAVNVFRVEAIATPGEIEFLRYAPGETGTSLVHVRDSEYSTTGTGSGPFVGVGGPHDRLGSAIDLAGPIPLKPAGSYVSGETIFLRVTDAGRNFDAAAIDTLEVEVVVPETGDMEVVRLFESGPDTGEFIGWLPVGASSVATAGDGSITATKDSLIAATYVDPFDLTDVASAAALVDPFGVVFDSSSGAPVDGVTVTLIDAATGAPAKVFGVDGVSVFPSTVTSGGSVTDASGRTYDFDAGEYRFPFVAPGEYELRIGPPENFLAPSSVPVTTLQRLPTAPFSLNDGSFGRPFQVPVGPAVEIDIPIDPRQNLFVTKEADQETAAIGEFIRYEIVVENNDDTLAADALLIDMLPRGVRYVAGSARRDEARIGDPTVGPDARELRLSLGDLAVGQSTEISYVAEVVPGVRFGVVTNEVLVRAPGGFLSNTATADVRILDDLFQSRAILIGRVAANACDEGEPWARAHSGGIGVADVRLYLEDGTYVMTDADGLYHIEGVEPGTHVVQVDPETLPEGYTFARCEENTRFAGSAQSQFVDVQGGTLWRVDFYLKPTGPDSPPLPGMNDPDAAAPAEDADAEAETGAEAPSADAAFDEAWLATQPRELAWAYPSEGDLPAVPSISFGIVHDTTHEVDVFLNGAPIDPQARDRALHSKRSGTRLSRWRGVDIREGLNTVEIVTRDHNGAEVARLTREIPYVSDIADVAFVKEASRLVADGRRAPLIAVRLTNKDGYPVHAGATVEVDVLAPYAPRSADQRFDVRPLTARDRATGTASVGRDGIALIELEPTLISGKATVRVKLEGTTEEIRAWIEPLKRDWVLVGLAEGTVGYNTVSGNAEALDDAGGERDLYHDGRVAFFAKGLIRGDWLLTVAFDSAKRRGDVDRELYELIDPEAYYTLYGDASQQRYEAESRYPLFVKLERNQAYALFGDFETDITETELATYTRSFSGFKTAYEDDRFSVVAFAAETNQGFVKDEIRADGTSGPYRLTTVPIVRNSESVFIETRDRLRADEVLERRVLVRFSDYDIDYDTGRITLKSPVQSTDNRFNPRVIVVDYEVAQATERNISYGGRGSLMLFDGRVVAGGTFVHEAGSASVAGLQSDLIGVDVHVAITPQTNLTVEYAYSQTESDAMRNDGDALLAEIEHTGTNWQADAYFREEDTGFGLGQQREATTRTRRFGANASVDVLRRSGGRADGGEPQPTARAVDGAPLTADTTGNDATGDDAQTGRTDLLPGVLSLEGEAYREEDLSTAANRNVAGATAVHEGDNYELSLGVRVVDEENASGDTTQTSQVTVGADYTFDNDVRVHAAHEQTFAGEATATFPTRSLIGIDFPLGDRVLATATHEIQFVGEENLQSTHLGFKLRPWTGAEITLGTDRAFTEDGDRLAATAGVAQSFAIDENWTISGGFERREVLSDSLNASIAELTPALSDEAFWAANAGLGYRADDWSAAARIETRQADEDDTIRLTAGAAGDFTEALSGSVSFTASELTRRVGTGDAEDNEGEVELRLGVAYRERVDGPIVLNRLDLKYADDEDGLQTAKAVNNLSLNVEPTDTTQFAVHYGAKYVLSEIDGIEQTGFTHVLGAEGRLDVTEWLDVGVQASALHSLNTGVLDYSVGASVGFTPMDNVWVSVGYNVMGFEDDDFAAAEFTGQGPFIKFRMKVDQDTVRGVLQRMMGSGAP